MKCSTAARIDSRPCTHLKRFEIALRAARHTLRIKFMHWTAPSEKDTATDTLEKRLWAAADQFCANSGLSAAQYSHPVLGLIFLRFAEVRFARRRARSEEHRLNSSHGGISRMPSSA